MNGFDGRVAIVTGASRGIGLAIAKELVAKGAKVCVTARKAGPLNDAVKELGGSDTAVGVPGAVDNADHQDNAIGTAIDAFGRLDMLVNNAGISPYAGPLLDFDLQVATKILAVNVLAPLAWTRRAHDEWMGKHGGAVVNVASVAGLYASPGVGMYGISKAALIRQTAELGAELAPGIRVNAVAPGVVKTRFSAPLYEGREDDLVKTYPMGRLGDTDDIARAAAFLLSDEAAWITGQTMVLDGGVTLVNGV